MLRLLFDQDFNHDILRGLLLRLPDVDAVTALQSGLDEAPDPELFNHIAENSLSDPRPKQSLYFVAA